MKIHPTSTKSSGLFGLSSRTITAFSMSVEPRCRLWQVRSKRERAKPTFFGPSWGHGWFYDVLPSGYLTVCHGKWPIYRWFTWVYLLKLVIMAMLVITRWYMFPKFGGNMCIDAKVADDTQEKTSRFAQISMLCRSAQLKYWLPPYHVVNHHCPGMKLAIWRVQPIVRQTLTVTHIAMRLQHATSIIRKSQTKGSRMI